MASGIQTKTLGVITDLAPKYGLEALKVSQWANTGKLSFQHPQQVGELLSVGYEFQSDTMTFTITVGQRRVLSQPPRQGYHDFYMRHQNVGEFTAFVARLEAELKAVATKIGTLPKKPPRKPTQKPRKMSASGLPDTSLSPSGLRDRYAQAGHKEYTRDAWKDAVVRNITELGYWEWVYARLQMTLDADLQGR